MYFDRLSVFGFQNEGIDDEKESFLCDFRQSSFGGVFVAVSCKGVCALLLGQDETILGQDFIRRFPNALIEKSIDVRNRKLDRIFTLIETYKDHGSEIPLDLRGSEFQQVVWRVLREIPYGKTASYSEIAKKIGAPGSARAVAGACRANPVALLVPCHRVLAKNKTISGYRWGVSLKHRLLEIENHGGLNQLHLRIM